MKSALGIMEDYALLKLKRKDPEEFSDDFSEFSLSSPARKIRRLDVELPPIVVQEECEMPLVSEYSPVKELNPGYPSNAAVKIDELSSVPLNEERAIVLFNPNSTASTSFISPSPLRFLVSVGPQILSGIKNHVLLPRNSNIVMGVDDDAAEADPSAPYNNCLAVIPWAPQSQPPSVSEPENSDFMDAQEIVEEEAMDVEDNATHKQSSRMLIGDGVHQWRLQQQHCFVSHPPLNTSSPVSWYQY